MRNTLAALVFLGLAGAGLTGQSPRLGSPTPLSLQAPVDTWDEALPLGNGLIGALVWGADHTIRISLDRGDLWDQRLPEIYSRPGWNYATMQRLKAEGNQAEMNRLFDIPYDTIAYPTKLPAGRVELTLPDAFTGRTFDLDLRRAETSVRGNAGAAKVNLKVGDVAPNFTLPGSDGRTYRLADYAGKQAVVLAWFAKAFTSG